MAEYYIGDDGELYLEGTSSRKKNKSFVLNSDGSLTEYNTPTEQTQPVQGSGWLQSGAFRDGVTLENTTKAVLGTATDASQDASAGFLSIFEETFDAIYAGFGKLLGWVGFGDAPSFRLNDKGKIVPNFRQTMTQRVEEVIAEEMVDEKAIVESVTPYTPLGWANNALGVDVEKDSVLAEKADALAGSVGHMVGTAVAAAAGIPAPVVTIITSFGSEVENAIKNGDATLDQAIASGLVSAGAEALTEQLFSGINIGKLPTADKAITTAISRGISNKTLRTLAKLGVDLAGEGAEEVISGVLSAVGQKLTYAKEADWNELFSSEAAWDSFVSGALMGAGGNLVGTVKSAINKTDYTTGLTKNEQAVVDQVYKDRVAEEQKSGKLTQLQKNEIYEQVVKDMDDGRITTDEIEKVLSKEELSKYKALSEEAAEYAKLYDTETGKMSQKQTDRLKELAAKNSELSYEKRLEQARQKITKDTAQKVSGDRLNESYLERDRKNVAYTDDAAKYKNEFARKTVQSAIDSKVLNNTRYSHRFVDLLAKIAEDRGVAFDFTNNKKLKETGMALEGVTVNGFLGENGITINANSSKALNSVVGHEVTHVLEGTDMYQPLEDIVFEYAKATNQYDKRMQELRSLYEGKNGYETDFEAKLKKELVADLVGDYIFTDEKFVESLFTKNRSLWDKVKHEIDYLLRVATAGSEEARKIEKAKKVFEKVYESKTKNPTGDGGNRYSFKGYAEDGKGIYESNFPKGTPKKAKGERILKYIQEVWSKKPIMLRIEDADGVRYVEAKFDPTYSEDRKYKTDASKLMGGNRHGSAVEQRVTLDLADDYYQIASESVYNYSKEETGKDTETHKDVKQWHYFVNDIYFAEQGSDDLTPYRVSINVKEKGNGNFFYSFSAEKAEGTSTQRTLHAAVSDSQEANANGSSSAFSLTDEGGSVNPQNTEITDAQNENGLDREQEAAFSLSRNAEYMDNAIAFNNKGGHAAPIALADAQEVRGRVADRMNEIKAKGLVALPEDIEGNTAFANSSYDVSEENTTICPRSLASEAFVDAVSEYLGRPLSVEEQIYISQDLQGRSLTPECTYCYVATDRKAYRAFLGEYISQRDNVIQKLKENPNADVSRKGDLYKEFLNGRKDTNPMYSRFKMWVDSYKNGTPMVEASHLANMNKLMGDINSEFGAELKPQIVDAMKYAQSASWAKKRVNYVAYNGHILKWKQDRINKLNSHYGLRMYSFSDFHPAFVLENMQMITDASVRGLKMLGYTKDTDFVDIFAPSGMNINVSTFGFEAGGNVYENNLIGAEWEKAKSLRAKYPNVGITFVATNDTLVKWALKQDWIDVVIPYHLVRTGTEVAKAFGYTNYTGESSDAKTGEWKKGDKKYIAPTEHNNDLNTYLEALNKNHLRPRFQRFLDDPETRPYYMKLVNECRQSAAQSQPVQPIFNEDAAMKALAKLEANGYYQPVGGSVDRMYEIAAEVAENMTNLVQASLSADGDTTPTKGWNIRGEDVAFVNSTEDLAPIGPNAKRVYTPDPNNLAPLPEKKLPADNRPIITANEIPSAKLSNSEKELAAPVYSDKLLRVDSNNGRPGEKRRKWVGTSTESDAVDGKVLPDDLNQDLIHYQPISNKKTLGNANARLDRMGYEASVTYLNSQFANNKVTLDDIALGERLIQEAVKRGDTKTAGDLIMDISILGTELGQKVQALSIIKRLTPEGQLRMLQRTIERGKTKGDKAFEGVELTQEMIDHILKTYGEDGSFDQAELNKAVEDVKQQIADQMKISVMDYINEWRYLAMLGNPKTHIRNMVSNAAMWATRQAKNAIARTIEDIAPVKERTKTWKRASDDVKAYAEQVTEEMYESEMDSKYSEAGSIKAKRQILPGVIGKSSKVNSDALSGEDTFFSKPAYRESLREFLTANGITTEADIKKNPEIVAKAKAYAMEQAKQATFQQDSYIASKISEIERKNPLLNIAIGSVLPFKKTPINVAKTAVAYSPLGIARNIYDAVQVSKGNMEVSEAIDHVAQTITGTSLTLIGYALASMGVLNGAGEDDKEGEYDYQLGEQSYSFNFNGDTFSLSWLSPVAMPLFVGANAYEQFVEKRDWNGNVVTEALAQTLDPLSEMSFLSSLSSVLSSYDDGMAAFGGMLESAGQSYITSFVPTLSSQIAQVMDDTKRSTKVAANSGWDFGEETWNKIKYKIPGLRNTLEPSTDIWGNEIKLSENVLEKAFETFLAPYARREDIATAVDEEIKDLYSQTGDTGLIPSIPNNYVSYDGEKYEMSAKEFTEFKKMYGQTAFDLMEQLFDTDTYRNADSETRADMVNRVYDYARDEARKEYFAKQGVEFTNATKEGKEYYKPDAIKGAIEADLPVDEYVFSEEYPEKYTLSKAITGDVAKYRKYTSDLYDIKADKDSSGKYIINSRKKKVVAYINDLDMDYGQKILLYRSEYTTDDRYNRDIVEYLNSRDDISAAEMRTILEALNFKVSEDGKISW